MSADEIVTGQDLPPTAAEGTISRSQKGRLVIWGLLWMGPGALAGLVFVLSAVFDGGDVTAGLGSLGLVLAGLVGGGLVAGAALRSLGRRPAAALRLPPTWALGGGFVLALAAGLGLWQAEMSVDFLVPLLAALAAVLAPLAAVAWALEGRPGSLSARRGGAAWGLGATAATSAAYLLNGLLSLAVVSLVWGLADALQPLGSDLLGGLDYGQLGDELVSPWFVALLVEVALIAPVVEELVKPLALLPLLRRLASPCDAFLLGALAGAGFAAVENLLYAFMFGPDWSGVLAVRAMGAALHPLGAGLVATGWWAVLHQTPEAGVVWARRYGLAAGLHALWNGTSLLTTAVAGAWLQGWEMDVLGLANAAVLLALLAAQGVGLLVVLRATARRLEPAAGGQAAPALPSELRSRAIAAWGLACLVVLLPAGLGLLRALL